MSLDVIKILQYSRFVSFFKQASLLMKYYLLINDINK